jgi:predicted acylesterase/phospholipase RssA
MGLTIVQKSDLKRRKKDPKVALVLAGGAVSGGAFKLGGIKALDDFLVNRKTTDFDTYVGLSAGAVLSAPLAAGISPAEVLKSLEGSSDVIDQFQALDFYSPNLREFVARPTQYLLGMLLYFPSTLYDLFRIAPQMAKEMEEGARNYLSAPTRQSMTQVVNPFVEWFWNRPDFPSLLDHLPTGLFDNASIERYIRRNFEGAGIPNDFRALYRKRRHELYISAMNLDTAERVVFGHDEDSTLTISEAVQASTALPGFYAPARIKGVDYVDGGVRRTANLDVAVEHGADLIICYNPFRPFSNRPKRRFNRATKTYEYEGPRMADGGLLSILNQVFRTLLHSRLQYGLRQYQEDPNFRGDIIVIEPKETDFHYFQLNALAYWQRFQAAQLGYESVTESIQRNYEMVRAILERYGLTMTRKHVSDNIQRMAQSAGKAADALTHDFPRRRLSVA